MYPTFKFTIIIITSLSTIFSCSFLENEILPDSPKELLEEGIKAIKLDQNLRARNLFTQLIEDFPDSKERSQALLLLARSHYSIEEYEEAKFHFQKFVDLYVQNDNELLNTVRSFLQYLHDQGNLAHK